jgi:hypothetical protein
MSFHRVLILGLIAAFAAPISMAQAPPTPEATADLARIRAIARDAYVFGFPMVETYKTMYAQAMDKDDPNYKGPFNAVHSHARVATPDDTAVVTPNSDTPYSFAWLDLRAEPVVLTVPPIEADRYFSIQFVDLYTHNFDYLGTRTSGNDGGRYLVAGPGWNGTVPAGIDRVLRSETQVAYAIYRTQLKGAGDLDNVRRIQAGYKAQTLTDFIDAPLARSAPQVDDIPRYVAASANDLDFFNHFAFLLQFAPAHAADARQREAFASVGLVPGKRFDRDALPPEVKQALRDGIAQANAELDAFRREQVDTGKVLVGDLFGTRDWLGGNTMRRFVGAKLGIFGNSREEANYIGYYVDAGSAPLDASRHDYVIRFPKGSLPPTRAFWSLTMYDGKSQLLVDNPIDRYLVNSPMLPTLQRDADGGITIHVQRASPGKARESNWLPAPDGPFYVILRNYAPEPSVLDGTWQRPSMQVAKD